MLNLYQKIALPICFALFILSSFSTLAQYTITGQNPAMLGNTYTYTCTRASGAWPSAGGTVWSVNGGTLLSFSINPADKRITTASVKWTHATDVNNDSYTTLSVAAGSVSGSASISVYCGTTASPTFNISQGGIGCAPTAFSISANGPSGTTIQWFNNSTDPFPFTTGPSFTTPTLSANKTYYICAYDYGTNCSSGKVAIPISFPAVPPQPTAPTFSFESYICGSSGSAQITATPTGSGNQVRWYSAASGGSLVATGTLYNTPTLTTQTTYYITSVNTANCGTESSPRTPVVVNVYPIPALPAVSNQAVCGPSSITLSGSPGANGNTVYWYNSANASLGSGNSFSAGTVSATTTYYARTINMVNGFGCMSAPATVTVTVNPLPGIPHNPFTSYVYGHGSVDLQAYADNGPWVYWYSAPTGGSPLATGPYFTTPDLSTATTYYAGSHDTSTGCESSTRLAVIADVRPITSAYKATTDYVRASGATDDTGLNAFTATQRTTQVTHVDGLLRGTQQVTVQGSPAGKDVVQATEYLSNGTTPKKYLPYVANTTDGSFRPSYKNDQASFYTAANDKIVNDSYPFAVLNSEDSPLGRTIEQSLPGQDWQPGGGHTKKVNYSYNTGSINSEAEEVRQFNADGTSTVFFAANTLNRLESTDEDGNKQITFTDGAGNTVVQKKQLDELINGVLVNYLQTYYVYDDFGRVQYVISPKGTAALRASGWNFTTAIRDNYCTQLVYDYRGRMVEKKTPGQASVYYVYDKMNRVVLVQDGLLRAANKWRFVKYDMKGHVCMQGLYLNPVQTTRANVQTLADGLYKSANTTYPQTAWFESRGTTLHGYTNVSFPKTNDDAGKTAIEVWGINYFESYDFDYNGSHDYRYDSTTFSGQAAWSNYHATDLATGSKQLILGTSNWLYTYVFYDDRGNAIQVRSNNHLSPAVDNLVTNIVDFEGKVLSRKKYHNAGAGKQTTVITTYEYDPKGRVAKVYQNNNSAPANQLVAAYEYNELGQLVDKKLHGNVPVNPTSYLQSVDYRFDIQGKLLSINNSQLSSDGVMNDDTNDYFGMQLAYNTGAGMGNTQRYNGTISAVTWKGAGATPGSADTKSYAFAYDKSGRLKNAASQMYTGSAWTKEANALNEGMTYDENGNIKTLQRNQRKHQLTGVVPSYTSEASDNLTYAYNGTIGDRLDKVTDAATPVATGGFDNGSSGTNTDYTYDANGNVLSDLNKGITNIAYNVMGKPDVIMFTDGHKVQYAYDASGNKLTLKTYNTVPALVSTTDYVDGFVYENNVLSFFSSAEGRVVNNAGTLEYQYAIADHQGNTRLVFTSKAPVVQTAKATFESDESALFTSYPTGGQVNHLPTNNTTPSGTNSQYLNGGYNGMVGVSKSFAVFPGDQLQIEAYARYNAPTGNSSSLVNFTANLLAAFQLAPPLGGEAGTAASALNNFGTLASGGFGDGSTDNTDPKAFINILLFDKNYNFLDVAYAQVNSSGAPTYLTKSYTVKEAGYAFLYISNENAQQTDVYFDDVTMTYTPTNIIQYNEYYPFGLQASTSWTRTNSSNKFLYNEGSEQNTTTGLYDLPYRNYDATLGRFMQVDPLAHVVHNLSPYQYAGNNPMLYNDPTGLIFGLKGLLKRIAENFTNDFGGGEGGEIQEDSPGSSPAEGNPGWGDGGGVSKCDNCPKTSEFDKYNNDPDHNYYYNEQTGEVSQLLDEVDASQQQGTYDPRCQTCLDPSTIGHNLLFLTYPGGDNPRSFNGQYNYSYVPSNLAEYPAIGHDRRYDNLGTSGIKGLLSDTRAIGADWKFVMEELSITGDNFVNPIDRINAFILGTGLGLAALPKTILQLSSPTGYIEVKINYEISNNGVTNKPSK